MKIMHVVSVLGGKDSLATLLIALRRCPRGSVVPIFCDTGNEEQQVYDYLDYMEDVLGVRIERLRADFAEQISAKREFISRDVRTKPDAHPAKDRRLVFADLNIHSRVQWAKTTRGGRQYDLLALAEDGSGCSSSYGLCEGVGR